MYLCDMHVLVKGRSAGGISTSDKAVKHIFAEKNTYRAIVNMLGIESLLCPTLTLTIELFILFYIIVLFKENCPYFLSMM